MANANINIIAIANTFGDWRVQTNNLANSINELRNGNYYKDNGNITIANGRILVSETSGVGLQIIADSLLQGTTTLNTSIVTGIGSFFSPVIMLSSLNVAGPVLFDANDSTFILAPNGDAVVNNLTVKGNTISLGNSILSTDTLVLRFNVATSGSGWINVNRGTGNTQASVKWNEANLNWEIINVSSNLWGTVLTTSNIADSVTSNSLIHAASANSVEWAYNTALVAYGQANTAYGQANAAFAKANLAYTAANSAQTSANVAYGQANSAYAQANLAYTQANNAISGLLPLTGGTMTGNIVMTVGTTINTATLSAVREAITTANVTTSTYSANLANTNIFDLTLTNANVAITFINVAASGNAHSITVILRQPSTAANGFSVANTVKWSNSEIPVLSSGIANKLDVLTFLTVNGGTTLYGAHSLANV